MIHKNKYYMVRAEKKNIAIAEFISNDYVAIGWNKLGQIENNITKENLKELLKIHYPKLSKQGISASAGQILRFYNEFKIGDFVITYNSKTMEYFTGKIISEVQYDNNV